MTKRATVAGYARISQDRSGEELGVTRQLQDCRAESELPPRGDRDGRARRVALDALDMDTVLA